MDIRTTLLTDKSKEQAIAVGKYIGLNPKNMVALMDCFYDKEEWILCQRTSWTLRYLAKNEPAILTPYLGPMIRHLKEESSDALIRNTVCVMQFIKIPEDIAGEVYEQCFDYLVDINRPTAIRAFSLTVLHNISHIYPELKNELIAEVELQGNHGTVGFKNRAKHVLHALRKEIA